MSGLVAGLAPRGSLVVVGAGGGPISVDPLALLFGERRIEGTLTGTPADAEDTLAFSALSGVRVMTEEVPLAEPPRAYERMMKNEAKFRMVLTMSCAGQKSSQGSSRNAVPEGMADGCSFESFADVLAVALNREEGPPPPSAFTTLVRAMEAQLSSVPEGPAAGRLVAPADAYRATQRLYVAPCDAARLYVA